jgi:hypothetical protein
MISRDSIAFVILDTAYSYFSFRFQFFSFFLQIMRIPRLFLPLLLVAALVGGWLLRSAFTQPTTSVTFSAQPRKTVVCTVDGVRCQGTAAFFTKLYATTPGIAAIETFAAEHQAVITYDPELISPDGIRSIMEAPIPLRDGTSRQVFVCQSMK